MKTRNDSRTSLTKATRLPEIYGRKSVSWELVNCFADVRAIRFWIWLTLFLSRRSDDALCPLIPLGIR